MSKTYKGYELIKAIEEGKIKENAKIEVHSLETLDRIVTTITYSSRRLNWKEGEFSTGYLCDDNYYFKVLEDEETIDIEECHINITCSELDHNLMDMQWYINKVLLPVINKQQKQINKLEGKK